MTGIYVAHTPSQAEQASTLVDLLESSLSLDESGIRCSTLPGYATTNSDGDAMRADIGGSSAVIALLDDHAMRDPQLMLELGVAFTYDKRMMLLVEGADSGEALPGALRGLSLVERVQPDALVSMVEDLAFELGLRPRLGDGAQEAIRQLSTAPPPPDEKPTVRPARAQAADEPVAVPRAAALPSFEAAAQAEAQHAPASSFEDMTVPSEPPPPNYDALPLATHDAPDPLREPALFDDADIHELDDDELDFEEAQPSETGQPGVSCVDAMEAGRAISECSYHRDEGGDFARELDSSFGPFIEALGGDWHSLRPIDDVDVWLNATDNLLEGLPPEYEHAANWYELGYQFSTLRSIAEGGFPADPAEHGPYQEIWQQSMDQFWRSADAAKVPPEDVARIRSMLENLLGPEHARDYANLARSLDALRSHAESAEKQRHWFG